jgi:histidyl-tRNA synthetase
MDEEEGSFSRVKAAAFEILSEARSAGMTAQMEMAGRSLKGQLGHADRLGARFVAVVGERDTLLKDMQGGSQETLETDKVVHAALRGLRELT